MIEEEIQKGREIYSDGLIKKYHLSKEEYQTPVKRLSEHKRKLVSGGLPIKFSSQDKQTFGAIYLSERGEIIVKYQQIDGKTFTKKAELYLIDANDEVLKNCEKETSENQ